MQEGPFREEAVKVHFGNGYQGVALPLCWPHGSPFSVQTRRKALVTCKHCKRILRRKR